jgi:hypothetical protein
MIRIASISLLGMLVVCAACKGPTPPPIVQKDTHTIVLVRIGPPDFRFRAFQVNDPLAISMIQTAITEDFRHPLDTDVVYACAASTYVSLCNSRGEEQYYSLAAHNLSHDGTRYQPDETTAAIEDVVSRGEARPISKAQAERLAPRAARHVSE